MEKIKICFIGWNENGEKCLYKLSEAGMKIASVFLPRGYEIGPMIDITKKYKHPVRLIENDWLDLERRLLKLKPDLLVVASFPKLLPENIISIPKFGTINVHASALPKNRGYHPINWTIIKDESSTGVTVHYLDYGMDNGEILAQKIISTSDKDNVETLRKKLTSIGANLLLKVVRKISQQKRRIKGRPQSEYQATFAPKRKPSDSQINWTQQSRVIFNLLRACRSDYPAYCFRSSGEKIIIKKRYLPKIPGLILSKIGSYYLVTTGDGALMVKTENPLKIGEILK